MSVEAECFRIRRLREDILVRSDSILPGSSEKLPYLQKVQILATCDVDNSSGTIRLKTPIRRSRKLSIMLFESPDDLEGHQIPYNEQLKITGEQELSIYYRAEKKEVIIYLNQESSSEGKTFPVDVDHLVPIA